MRRHLVLGALLALPAAALGQEAPSAGAAPEEIGPAEEAPPSLPLEVPEEVLEGAADPPPEAPDPEPENPFEVEVGPPPPIVPDVDDGPLVPAQPVPRDLPVNTPPSAAVTNPAEDPGPMASVPTVDPNLEERPLREWSVAFAAGLGVFFSADTDPVTGGGFLADEGELYFARFEQRIEYGGTDLGGIRLGLGVGELLNDRFAIIEIGPRLGLGAFFCEEEIVRCEGVLTLQPGVAFGTNLGATFDVYAALEGRFTFFEWMEIGVGAAFSRFGNVSVGHFQASFGVQP
jgi:hypothetical protein